MISEAETAYRGPLSIPRDLVDLILGRRRTTWADLGYGVDGGVMG